ncbi:hypothetical protein HanRHA438_Chr05g0240011 [Helianthus annuus]|nr:hypothetical protein HanRHA438_Chr05g0240011 [Helianthus annuus]
MTKDTKSDSIRSTSCCGQKFSLIRATNCSHDKPYSVALPAACRSDLHHANASPLNDWDTYLTTSLSAHPLISTTVSISSIHVMQSTAPFSPVKSLGLQDTKYLYVQDLLYVSRFSSISCFGTLLWLEE